VSADILVMLNIPSREGHRYALHTIDHALSKTSWAYPLKARETKVIRRFVEEDLPKLSIVLLDFHSDRGSELIAKELRQLLHVNTSHSPRDTPQMNQGEDAVFTPPCKSTCGLLVVRSSDCCLHY
jgi:hypothetical protein